MNLFLPQALAITTALHHVALAVKAAVRQGREDIISWLEKFYYKHQGGLKSMGRDVPNLGTPLPGCPKPWYIPAGMSHGFQYMFGTSLRGVPSLY